MIFCLTWNIRTIGSRWSSLGSSTLSFPTLLGLQPHGFVHQGLVNSGMTVGRCEGFKRVVVCPLSMTYQVWREYSVQIREEQVPEGTSSSSPSLLQGLVLSSVKQVIGLILIFKYLNINAVELPADVPDLRNWMTLNFWYITCLGFPGARNIVKGASLKPRGLKTNPAGSFCGLWNSVRLVSLLSFTYGREVTNSVLWPSVNSFC